LVLYDSWPVPAAERFRDPQVAAGTTLAEFRDQRAESLAKAVGIPLDAATRDEYLEPFGTEERMRSWIAMAAAADARFTLDLLAGLRERALPTLLLWGADDDFQPVHYAGRFAREVPNARLVRIPGARHLPMQDQPDEVSAALDRFLRPTERIR
jgi:pimeloyl-ACP methyl ester carboxylesterase